MNHNFTESVQIVPLLQPGDLAAGANTGDWVSLKNWGRVTLMFSKEPGGTGDDPTVTVLQGTSVAGSNSKALNIHTVYKKQAATDLTAVGTWTKSTSASPASNDTFSTNTWTNSALGEQALLAMIEFKAEDLDVDGGFDCISVTIADVGTAGQYGALYAILSEPRYALEAGLSAIAN